MKWICLISIILFSCSNKLLIKESNYYDNSNNRVKRYYNNHNTLIKEEIFDQNNQLLMINKYDYNIKKTKKFYSNQKLASEQTYRLIRIKNKKNKEWDEYLKQFKNQHIPWRDLIKNMDVGPNDIVDIIEIENIKEVKVANMNNWNDFKSNYGFLIKDAEWYYYNLDGSTKKILFYNLGFLEQKITYDKNNIIKVYNYDNEGNLID